MVSLGSAVELRGGGDHAGFGKAFGYLGHTFGFGPDVVGFALASTDPFYTLRCVTAGSRWGA